jgi:circadian clock protein KaiB
MATRKSRASSRSQQTAEITPRDDRYVLQLYIAGMTPRSNRALLNLHAVCQAYLVERFRLEVIDIYEDPERAKSEQIVAIPALIKKHPPPEQRLIGDLSDRNDLLLFLNLPLEEKA